MFDTVSLLDKVINLAASYSDLLGWHVFMIVSLLLVDSAPWC